MGSDAANRIESGSFASFTLCMLASFSQGGYPGGGYNMGLALLGMIVAGRAEGHLVFMYTGFVSLSIIFDIIQISMDVYIGPLVFSLIMMIFNLLLKLGLAYTGYTLYRELGGSWSLASQRSQSGSDYAKFEGSGSLPGPPSYDRPSFSKAN